MHRTLENGIISRLDGKKNWLQELPWVWLGLRIVPNTDTGVSPSMMVLGQQPDIPGQMVLPKEDIQNCSNFTEMLSKALQNQVINNNTPWHGGEKRKQFIPDALMRTEKVLVRMDAKNPSLAARYNGPYSVLERNDKSFILQPEEKTDSISIDRLVPFYS